MLAISWESLERSPEGVEKGLQWLNLHSKQNLDSAYWFLCEIELGTVKLTHPSPAGHQDKEATPA